MKQIFNISFADNNQNTNYKKFLEHIFNKYDVNFVNYKEISPDLIVFTGGEDVNPQLYSEKVGQKTFFNSTRDEIETDAYFTNKRVPKLGICRGAQFLTVMNGGKLIQDVNNHEYNNHQITIVDNDHSKFEIEVNSLHHQMMYPFNLREDNYELVAYSTYFNSSNYLNGNDTQINLPQNFLEPEIVYYNNTNSLCLQFHPELMDYNSKEIKIITNIINTKLLKL